MKYHTNELLAKDLRSLTDRFPIDSTLFSIGKSIKGTELLGVRMSRNVSMITKERGTGAIMPDMRPMVKLIGNIHGNEPVGRELLIHFAKFILEVINEG